MKKLIKMGVFIMAILGTLGASGCSSKAPSEKLIEDKLYEIYGEGFSVSWSQKSDFGRSMEANVGPTSNSDIKFTVHMNDKGELLYFEEERYYTEKVWDLFNKELIQAFFEEGLEVYADCTGFTDSDDVISTWAPTIDTTLEEYILLNQPCGFRSTVLVNESDGRNPEVLHKIVKSLEVLNSRFKDTNLYFSFYFMEDDGYRSAKFRMGRWDFLSDTIIESLDAKYEVWNGVINNQIRDSIDTMLEEMIEIKNYHNSKE